MRLVLVPLILAAILAVGPTAVHANSNQAAAEKIAASLGDQFPGYDIAVSYQNGKVRLVGQVSTPAMAQQVVDSVKKVSGINVTSVDSGLRVANMAPQGVRAPDAARSMPVAPPAPARVEAAAAPAKRSIWSPPQAQMVQPQSHIASAPIPMPGRQLAQQPIQQVGAQQPMPQLAPALSPQEMQMMQQQALQQNAYHPEAYGPQGPMPGQYNSPNLPDYAWPSYACYPNYAEVSYPKQYSPKAWPHIGPFYPYPQVPLGWRKVTMEHHDGWWWLDFDDGAPSGPFSPLFRQPVRYTY